MAETVDEAYRQYMFDTIFMDIDNFIDRGCMTYEEFVEAWNKNGGNLTWK